MWGSFNMLLKWLYCSNFLHLEYFLHPSPPAFIHSSTLKTQFQYHFFHKVSHPQSCMWVPRASRCAVQGSEPMHPLGSPYCSHWWEACSRYRDPRGQVMSQVQEVMSVIRTKCCDHPGREETSIWPGPSKESAWKICLCWVLKDK